MSWYDPRDWSAKEVGLALINPLAAGPAIAGKKKAEQDSKLSTTVQGGASGAVGGAAVGGPVGALIGGGIGLAGGYMAGKQQRKAEDAQKAGLAGAQDQLEQLRTDSYGRRMADLNQALKFYDPARSEMKRLYGMDFAMPQFGGLPGAGGGGGAATPGAWKGSLPGQPGIAQPVGADALPVAPNAPLYKPPEEEEKRAKRERMNQLLRQTRVR